MSWRFYIKKPREFLLFWRFYIKKPREFLLSWRFYIKKPLSFFCPEDFTLRNHESFFCSEDFTSRNHESFFCPEDFTSSQTMFIRGSLRGGRVLNVILYLQMIVITITFSWYLLIKVWTYLLYFALLQCLKLTKYLKPLWEAEVGHVLFFYF